MLPLQKRLLYVLRFAVQKRLEFSALKHRRQKASAGLLAVPLIAACVLARALGWLTEDFAESGKKQPENMSILK